jgi:hypothetical protein
MPQGAKFFGSFFQKKNDLIPRHTCACVIAGAMARETLDKSAAKIETKGNR